MESNDWYGLPENEEEQPNTSNEARKFQEITTHLPFQNLSSSETLLKKKLKVAVPKLPYTRAVGLLGGSPMWNRGAKRLPSGATNLSNTPKSNLVNVKTPVDGESSTKVESHINKSSLLAKRSQLKKNSVPSTSKTNLIAQEYNESEVSGFQKQTKLRLRSNKNNLHATENNQVDDIVVIDSSPDEKIRIMDYEDDNDKNIVAAEVSLSSVAQNVADSDDIPVIEMSTEFGIVASPMESEEPGEYMLFSSDVVDYVATTSPGDNNLDNGGILSSSDDDDMDESISEIVNMNDENNFEVLNHPNNDDHPYLMPEDDGMSTGSEVMIVEPNNDKSDLNKQSNSEHNTFNVIPSEIRRDTVLSNVVTVNCANDETKTVQSMVTKSVATTSTAALLVKPTVVPYGHLPISAAMIASKSGVSFTQTKPNTIVTTGHKKLETQTTAKVSIGNTTISVPVLKNVQMANQSKGGEPLNKNIKLSPTTFSLNLANKSTVINVGGHKINTKNLNNVRIVQALRQRGQQQNKLEQLSTETAIERLKAMSKSPALTYKNLSSLTVTQDTALPNKIFDDESPDSSIEHDDHNDLISPTPEQQDLNCSTTSDTATKQLPSSLSSDNKVMVPDTKEKDSAGDDLDNMMENITGESNKSAPQTIDTMAVTDDLVSTLSDNSQDSPQQELSKQQMQQKKQASAMPVHIVIKSTESSLSSQPKSITSHLPQLSPLSQPNELTTNLANASQQLRSIMSSIHQPSSVKTTTITTTTETIHPNESKILDVNKDLKSITNQHQSALIVTSHPTITVTTNPSITPAATGNLILLKQHPSVNVTMANRLNQVGLSKLKDEKNNQQLANENDNNQKVSTIVSILNSPQQPPQIQQSRLITVSSQSTQMSAPLSRPVVVSSSCGGIQVAHQTSLLNKSDSDTKPTMSILSAQLQQPLTKNTSTGGQQIHHTFTELSSQLSGLPFRRSKSTDETPEQAIRSSPAHIQATKRHNSCEVASIVKSEPLEQVPSSSGGTNTLSGGDSTNGGCRFSNVFAPPTFKADETQNVLLKQLLQNTSNCTIPSPSPPSQIAPTPRPNTSLRAPSLGVVNSLEDQLSRPVIPPAPANPSQQTTVGGQVNIQKTGNIAEQLKSRKLFNHETSFISKVQPMPPSPKEILSSSVSTSDDTKTSTASILSQSQTAIGSNDDNKLSLHPSVPPPPYSVAIKLTEPAITSTPNLTIKTELVTSQSVNQMITSAITTPTTVQDVIIKKELMDDNSQLSAASDQSAIKSETISQTGEYSADGSTPVTEATPKTGTETALELKRKKRREYQKSRRQMQLNKETGPSRKRSKKPAKLEEDYDTFIDTLMNQLRQMPPMQILEPLLSRNYGVCPSYGSGELSKIGPPKTATSNSKTDEFAGGFGSAEIPTVCDFYNTSPFGSKSPLLDTQSVSSTHYGFYDQEFSPIRFDTENDTNNHSHKYDYLTKDRDVETPDTIISSSSPECHAWESHSKSFPGLRLIQEESDDEMASITSRMSPSIPVLAPVPVRLTTGINLTADKSLGDIKNGELTIGKDSRFCPPSLLKEQSNMKVTLTLTSSAAEDIVGVLRDLANILHIPQPKTYEIIERTTTPPSQKLGLYRTRDKDGNEGAPIDIQTILNGEAKFCRHCDVVILNKMIKAKASEFPLLALNNNIEILNETDDLYFCSRSCYKQFKWRPTSILDDKTLDNTAKIGIDAGRFNRCDPSKELTVLTTTSLAVGDMSEDDLKMDMDQDTTILDDSSLGDTRLDTSTKSTVSSNVTLTGSDKESGTITPAKKPVRFMTYSQKAFASPVKYKRPTEKDTIEALFRMNITVTPGNRMPDDTRQCIFCHQLGDSVPDGASRLLNFDVDKWVHLNCALWSDGVYETVSGGLCNMEAALQASLAQPCTLCQNLGATIKCFKNRCANVYHLNCAQKDDCVFYKNKTVHCSIHAPKTEKDNELTTLCVQRRVYIERDESRQVAAIMHHSELSNLMRVGSLILLNVGQLLPHQLQAFHSPNYIYPIGYKIVRFFWSMRLANKRCRYICSIADVRGKPEFRVLIQEQNYDDLEVQDVSPKAVWQKILASLVKIRTSPELVKIFPQYISGEDLFGLTEPAIVRILESLPGIETLTDYHFKYGRNPLLELPLAINPSGAARTEPKQKQTMGWKKPHTQRTGSSSRPAFVPTNTIAGEVACPYSKQFVHSKSSQYKKMKQEWRNNVFLARSKIQGLGLYAARDLEKHTMVIEYIGEVIRTQLSELREKQYEARNRGIYMFRLDEERVVDATLSGGLARYINHSCNPNCVTEIVEVDREYRIIIFAKRRITRGEELSYDYKFDIEDDAHKIPCMCGAPNCRKWMN